ncbi:MAG: hypothetical protein ACK4Z9_00025 [Thermodesulfovibrionales bacterium]
MQKEINELKKKVFYEMLNLGGRVFILVRYSDNVMIGKRGFTEEEKKNGIILVFNQRMNFSWDDSGISATLVFGTTPERCFIPSDDIIFVFSPELRSQFIVSPETTEEGKIEEGSKSASEDKGGESIKEEKVVKVDFSRKKRPR